MKQIYSAVVIVLSLFVISCSASKQTTVKSTSSEQSFYPEWYSASKEFTRSEDSTSFRAYGMAIATDSSTAIEKARIKAASNLEQHISSALESVRKKAGDKHSELNTPEFIFALRQVEATVSDAASSSQTSVRKHPGYGSFHGFAEVTITRKALVEKLGSQFAGNKNSWDTLESSEAFNGL